MLHTTQIDRSATLINFGIGQPGFDLLPHEILQRAAVARFAEGDTEFLNYGYEQGDERFRQALAAFLSRQYSIPVDASTLMITAGASQALDQICTLYTQPGDTIFVEEPSYFIALRILLEDHKLNAVPISTDEHGLNVDALEDALSNHRPRLLYTIPTFQNPTGRTLPLERRKRLVALAEAHDFMIVADEVYHALHYSAAPPAPVASFLESGRVLSVGSFSKILAPGLRLGWVQSHPDHVERFVTSGLVDSGGGLNHFTSNIVRVVLEANWQEEYLQGLRETYRSRIQVMDTALREAGIPARWRMPAGGYFFWLEFDEAANTADLLSLAQEAGVGFLPGSKCSSQGALRNCLRLSFAHYDETTITTGIERLGQVLAGL